MSHLYYYYFIIILLKFSTRQNRCYTMVISASQEIEGKNVDHDVNNIKNQIVCWTFSRSNVCTHHITRRGIEHLSAAWWMYFIDVCGIIKLIWNCFVYITRFDNRKREFCERSASNTLDDMITNRRYWRETMQ